MHSRISTRRQRLRAISAGTMAAMAGCAAAEWQAPRTHFGAPDLQGTWTSATVTTLERPSQASRLVLTDAEAAYWEQVAGRYAEADARPTDPDEGAPPAGADVGGYNAFWIDPGTRLMRVNGQARTSIIVDPTDGRVPYTNAGRARLNAVAYARQNKFDGPEQRLLGERCIVGFGSTGGPPMLPVLYNNHYQIVQSPGIVMILVEMNHDARIVRIDGEHVPASVTPWLGDSIGRWDGDTLVVETTNFHPGQSFRAAIKHRLYLSPEATVTERFTRTSDGEILYQFRVDDPETFTQAWRGELPLLATDERIFEYACHEGNYALPGILAGARAEEADPSTANAGAMQ